METHSMYANPEREIQKLVIDRKYDEAFAMAQGMRESDVRRYLMSLINRALLPTYQLAIDSLHSEDIPADKQPYRAIREALNDGDIERAEELSATIQNEHLQQHAEEAIGHLRKAVS